MIALRDERAFGGLQELFASGRPGEARRRTGHGGFGHQLHTFLVIADPPYGVGLAERPGVRRVAPGVIARARGVSACFLTGLLLTGPVLTGRV
ncbi:hypothetical protein GCM10009818_09260 [Nakamurella flavida]